MENLKLIKGLAVISLLLLLWINIKVDFSIPVKIFSGEPVFASQPVYGNGYDGKCYRCETSWPPNFALISCWESPNHYCVNAECMYMAGGC